MEPGRRAGTREPRRTRLLDESARASGGTAAAGAAAAVGGAGPLPLRAKLLYGAAGLGAEALDLSRGAWLVYFYAPPAGSAHPARLPLAAVSVILFAGKLIEAFADTLVGYWSDRTTSRLGQRLPFILLGTPPLALFAVLLFSPPTSDSPALVALSLFATLELFYLCQSLVSVPYDALLPEVARTSGERVSLSFWRVVLGVCGAGVGLVASGLLIDVAGFRGMALTLALLALGCRYLGVAGIWRWARREPAPAPLSLRASLGLTFANRPFLVFLLSFVLFSTALAMLVAHMPYYVETILRQERTGLWTSLLTATGLGAMVLALPLFARLARRTSQEHAYLRAMLLAGLALPLLALTGLLPGIPVVAQALGTLVLVGAPLGAVYLFPGPIIAALCDAEVLATGRQRAGMFYSAQSFLDKLTEAFAPLLLGLLLLLGGSAEHPLGVRLVGPLAGLLVLAGYLAFRSVAGTLAPGAGELSEG